LALTITFDKLVSGRIILMREPGEDTVATIEYVIAATDGRFPQPKAVMPPLTAQQKTQLNNIWDAAATYIRGLEGL